MNLLYSTLNNPAVLTWGWVLLHFLWQGTCNHHSRTATRDRQRLARPTGTSSPLACLSLVAGCSAALGAACGWGVVRSSFDFTERSLAGRVEDCCQTSH